MPAISISALHKQALSISDDPLKVICAWPVSGQYGTGTRVLSTNPLLTFRDAVDMDIFGAFQLCAIGILAAPVTVMLSRTYFNDPGRNTIFAWTFLLLVGLLCMTIEFYRIQTTDCTLSSSGIPVSSNAAEFPYIEGNNCDLICSVRDGPSSLLRGGSANNIYVVPAPDKLTFGTATLLAAACSVHATLCLILMRHKVLTFNWKTLFGGQDQQDSGEKANPVDTSDSDKSPMKTVNETIGYFLKILAVPVFGGAGLAILIIGEINFFSPQVNYQTEPMANVGQWAPVAGTSLVMLGSLYLLLAKHAKEDLEEPPAHQCECWLPPSNQDQSQERMRHSEDNVSSHSHRGHGSTSHTMLNPSAEGIHVSASQDEHSTRSSLSFCTQDAPSPVETPLPKRGLNRRKFENTIRKFGEFLGTPAEDFITQPRNQNPLSVDAPAVPGEALRNPRWHGIESERVQHQVEENTPPRSRAGSSASSNASSQDPEGDNPIGEVVVEFLGEQTADNSASRRDLGFTGQLQGKWYAVYGDTLWCDTGVTDAAQDTEGFHGMVRNSLSALTDDPLVVHDLHLNQDEPVPHQQQLVPFNEAWGETNTFGFGGTSIVETDASTATGALYYLVNDAEHYKGAGIARLETVDGVPTVTQRMGEAGWWWDGDRFAKYGDIAAYRDVNSDFIYVLGRPPNSICEWPSNQYVYQARVRATDAFDLSKYEYWWGRDQGWKEEMLTDFNCETAIMWGVGQGQIVYNEHFGAYIYVYLDLVNRVKGGTVCLRTAPNAEGPWTDNKEIFKAEPIDGGLVYAGIAYPHLDETGKTLTIGFTNNNHIQVIKVTF
ncbi:hypothetical protein FZEAL_7483 [Fusarium zealandicum]|uniref:DUF4185 domain-containing protein n=1 Tax=Fusarium zealandicum TaxID=1053134 RepID=A0A8H4UFR7_9HYPO|nr:hypothetical protein FZEAL_7483 [Fusarium zealandicum]